jgi:polyisoprenoid-binding protein YceI
VWTGFSGEVQAEQDDLAAAQMNLAIDMKTGDAGDWLKNRKMRKDMDFDRHPRAEFNVKSISNVEQEGDNLSATVEGSLSWRGKSVDVTSRAKGTLNQREISAVGEFDLDITTLGITPPKILMIKVHDVVSCRVELHARCKQ